MDTILSVFTLTFWLNLFPYALAGLVVIWMAHPLICMIFQPPSSPPQIDRDAAIEIIRKHAEQKGWPFNEAFVYIHLKGHPRCYRVTMDTRIVGGRARLVIDAETGEIISEWVMRR
jgi:hypothetical protein